MKYCDWHFNILIISSNMFISKLAASSFLISNSLIMGKQYKKQAECAGNTAAEKGA
jgi:hypothetical protein